MRLSVRWYVTLTVVAAFLCVGCVAHWWPNNNSAPIGTLVVLTIASACAELVRIRNPAGGFSSFASWPLAAAFLIAPTSAGVVVVFVAATLMQVLARRTWLKSIFNIAEMVLAVSIGIVVFRILGGTALQALDADSWTESLSRASRGDGIPSMLAIFAYVFSGTWCVAGVLSLAQGQRVVDVWKTNYAGLLSTSALAIPIIPWFAWQTIHSGIVVALIPCVVLGGVWFLLLLRLRLDQTHQDLLTTIVYSIESRDPYTSGHSVRVQKYSTIIGRSVGLDVDELDRLGLAARLHDVGKAEPKHTGWIKSPDPLGPDERRVMEQHPQDGANYVGKAWTLQDLVKPILHHHENWDGSGFPTFLSGEHIPLHARIIRIADAIDAMTTDRPYKPKKNATQVRIELEQFSGTWFDPNLVRTLLASQEWHVLHREIAAANATETRAPSSTPRRSRSAFLRTVP